MNILFLALGVFTPEGGMERFNQKVIQAFSELLDDNKILGVTVISLWDKEKGKPGKSNIHFLCYSSSKMKTLWSFLLQTLTKKPDVVIFGHILFAPLSVITRMINSKAKICLFCHGVEVWNIRSRITKFVLRHFIDRFIAVSDFTVQKMVQQCNLPKDAFSLIYNAVDLQDPEQIYKIAASSSLNLLTVCRLSKSSKHKNVDKVIEALPQLIAKFPNLEYTIVGDGNWRGDLEELSVSLGIEDHVHFTGWIDDLQKEDYYRSASIFILPSVGEGFGIVFLEAWKYFLPVITSDKGASQEIVENKKSGLCISPMPNLIAQAIDDLLSSERTRKQMGQYGHDQLITKYSFAAFKQRLYQSLVSN